MDEPVELRLSKSTVGIGLSSMGWVGFFLQVGGGCFGSFPSSRGFWLAARKRSWEITRENSASLIFSSADLMVPGEKKTKNEERRTKINVP